MAFKVARVGGRAGGAQSPDFAAVYDTSLYDGCFRQRPGRRKIILFTRVLVVTLDTALPTSLRCSFGVVVALSLLLSPLGWRPGSQVFVVLARQAAACRPLLMEQRLVS